MDISGGSFDHVTMGEAFGFPGIDPRQHITFGLVCKGDESNPAVVFDEEYGQVLVSVTLVPSRLVVTCRVATGIAGNGEGEYFPFLENDEVIVAIPDGDERAGCTIIGRLNSAPDAFPRSVAGQDVTKNNFAFRRLRVPYIFETASTYLVRGATSKAFLSLDSAGSWTISDGNNNNFHIGADFIGMAAGDNSVLMQLDLHEGQFIVECSAGTKLIIDGSASSFSTTGTLSIATSGGQASNHVVTVESLINILWNVLKACPPITPAIATAGIVAGIPAAAATPLNPAFAGLIKAGLLAAVPDPLGLTPGIGRPGLMV